jgi:deuterolysin
MRKRVKTTGLQKDAFTSLGAGESIELSIDMAAVHDLSTGGSFKVSSFGAIPYADANSTILVPGRALTYSSNVLEVTVDGTAAAKVPRAFNHEVKRTELQSSSCTSSQKSSLTSALNYCEQLASAAATAASSGSATKFKEYFKTTSSSTRGTVAARLNAVANECSSTTSGKTTYYCEDVYNGCESNVLAYTLPSENLVVSCPIYFDDLPVLTQE